MNLTKFGALICVFLFATVIAGKSRSKLRKLKNQLKTCSNNMFICALDPNDRKCDLTCIPRDQECDGKPQCPMKDDEHCPSGQCGKTTLSSVYVNPNGPDVLSIQDLRKYGVERKLTGYLNMVDLVNGQILPHYDLNRTVTELAGPTFMFTNTFRAKRDDAGCVSFTGVANPIDNKAYFLITNEQITASVKLMEIQFSSCPDKYIFACTCIGFDDSTNTCPSTNGCLLLYVPFGGPEAIDDFPYEQALIDLRRNSNLKLGDHTNIQTQNIIGTDFECSDITMI